MWILATVARKHSAHFNKAEVTQQLVFRSSGVPQDDIKSTLIGLSSPLLNNFDFNAGWRGQRAVLGSAEPQSFLPLSITPLMGEM